MDDVTLTPEDALDTLDNAFFLIQSRARWCDECDAPCRETDPEALDAMAILHRAQVEVAADVKVVDSGTTTENA